MVVIDMMTSLMKLISAFFLLSLCTNLGSQARMVPGEYGIFKTVSINYNEEKEWISMIAEQILTSTSSFISNYRRDLPPPPPSPRTAFPVQPAGMSDYSKKAPPSPLECWIIISGLIKRPARPSPPPPGPGVFQPKTGIIKRPGRPSPPGPGAFQPRTGLSGYGLTAKSPPPPPYASPSTGDIIIKLSHSTQSRDE